MPRFFFHVRDGWTLKDQEGVEFAGVQEARIEAVRAAGAILEGQAERFSCGADWVMEVADESGHAIFRLRFSCKDV